MCSIIDFIERQKYFIESKRKTIKSLNQFLDSFDKRVVESNHSNPEPNGLKISSQESQLKSQLIQTNGQKITKKSVSAEELRHTNDLMLESDSLFGWLGSGRDDHKRQQLAEERRKEYNEYLRQKSKLEYESRNRRSIPVTTFSPNYKELLHKKQNEEQKYRALNGFNDIEDIIFNDSVDESTGRKQQQWVPTVGWFYCSNNKYVPEYITPRSRLLASHSSRVRAQAYSEELKKQVEEKERLKAIERERIRREDEELERRIEEQRIRLLKEFEEERRERIKKAELDKEVNRRMVESTTPVSPLSTLRSPSYLHIKGVRPLSSSPKKYRSASRSLSSALSETSSPIRGQSTATQTSFQQKPDLTSAQVSDSEPSSDEEDNEEENRDEEFRKRVLSRLSEVRRMMESDHIVMMEQLRHQLKQSDD